MPSRYRRFRAPSSRAPPRSTVRASVEQRLRMARPLGLRHREPHAGEQPALAALDDVPLRLVVRLGAGDADGVETQLLAEPDDLGGRSCEDSASVKAIRIHEDGGPEVLRYEDVPDPEPADGEVLVELRAASLNHLDVWIRKGLPSVPKPRILGADGAGVLAGTDERVVINPAIVRNGKMHILGETTDGTHAELIAVPRDAVHPIPHDLSFEEAAAFPLVFETAYRMLVHAGPPAGRRVGADLGHRRRRRARRDVAREGARRAASSSPRRATRSSSARDELGADAAVNHSTGRRRRVRQGGDRRRRARRRRRRR